MQRVASAAEGEELGFRVEDLGFKDLGFRVFRVEGVGFRMFWFQDLRFMSCGLGMEQFRC